MTVSKQYDCWSKVSWHFEERVAKEHPAWNLQEHAGLNIKEQQLQKKITSDST